MKRNNHHFFERFLQEDYLYDKISQIFLISRELFSVILYFNNA
jgi:hypothetical protein